MKIKSTPLFFVYQGRAATRGCNFWPLTASRFWRFAPYGWQKPHTKKTQVSVCSRQYYIDIIYIYISIYENFPILTRKTIQCINAAELPLALRRKNKKKSSVSVQKNNTLIPVLRETFVESLHGALSILGLWTPKSWNYMLMLRLFYKYLKRGVVKETNMRMYMKYICYHVLNLRYWLHSNMYVTYVCGYICKTNP